MVAFRCKRQDENPSVVTNANIYDQLMSENHNVTIDEDILLQGLNAYYNMQRPNHEKNKSITKGSNENSGNKKG